MISRRSLLAGLASLPAVGWSLLGPAARADEAIFSLLTASTVGLIDCDMALISIADLVRRFREAGVLRLLCLIDGADFPGPPMLAVPNQAGIDARRVEAILIQCAAALRIDQPRTAEVRGFLVAGSPGAVDRLRTSQPEARRGLRAALAANPGPALIRVAIEPGNALRQALTESFPEHPAELGGEPLAAITQGMNWLSLVVPVLPADPKQPAQIMIQARSPQAAVALERVCRSGLTALAPWIAGQPEAGDLSTRVGQIKPEVRGDQVVAAVDAGAVLTLVGLLIRGTQGSADRSISIHNLKQMGLAMHNYHATHDHFPPAFRADAAHQPLLSWRVLILPFLDEQALYDQFHLDEPWDSSHNRTLIPRMPRVYAAPNESTTQVAEGQTTYLTPRGLATIFPGEQPVAIRDITDGTSNTILILGADADSARIWTRPDDWDATRPIPHQGSPVVAAFGDGSVKTLPREITPTTWQKLLTRNGGEVLTDQDG